MNLFTTALWEGICPVYTCMIMYVYTGLFEDTVAQLIPIGFLLKESHLRNNCPGLLPLLMDKKIAFDIVDHLPQVTMFYKISVGISSVAGFCMFFPLLLGKWKTLRELLETIWSRGSKGIEAWFDF